MDTGQIMSIQDFVQVHDANKMSAPLGTKFELREAELNEAKEKLNLSDVLILSGPAGVGKTRLALQICRELASENGYEILCIKSNGLELYEDLVTTIEEDKNYLAFVDDANELTGLHFCSGFSVQNSRPKEKCQETYCDSTRLCTPTSDKSNTGSKETINYKGRMPNRR